MTTAEAKKILNGQPVQKYPSGLLLRVAAQKRREREVKKQK